MSAAACVTHFTAVVAQVSAPGALPSPAGSLPPRAPQAAQTYGGTVTVHTGGRYDSHLLLPVIPD